MVREMLEIFGSCVKVFTPINDLSYIKSRVIFDSFEFVTIKDKVSESCFVVWSGNKKGTLRKKGAADALFEWVWPFFEDDA